MEEVSGVFFWFVCLYFRIRPSTMRSSSQNAWSEEGLVSVLNTPDTAYRNIWFSPEEDTRSLYFKVQVVEHGMVIRCIYYFQCNRGGKRTQSTVRLSTLCIYNSLWFFCSLRPPLVYNYSTHAFLKSDWLAVPFEDSWCIFFPAGQGVAAQQPGMYPPLHGRKAERAAFHKCNRL